MSKQAIQGFLLPLHEDEKNLLGMLLNRIEVPAQYAKSFVIIQDRFNGMELQKIGEAEISEDSPAPADTKVPKAGTKVSKKVAKKKTTKANGRAVR